MDPLWRPTAVVAVVSTVTVGVVVSVAVGVVGVMVGVASAGVPRCQQHLGIKFRQRADGITCSYSNTGEIN